MKRRGAVISPSLALAIASLVLGCVSAWLLPLERWSPALPGLVTASSLLAGAALVRMARNAPITSPSTFNEEDLKRFFDTLEVLAQRLFWLFIQTLFAIAVLISAAAYSSPLHPQSGNYEQICRILSGFVAASAFWLFFRMISMARGDLGFIKLQRHILENALSRERRNEASTVVNSTVSRISPGRFGGLG